MSPTEQNGPSLPSPDYRTKAQTDEKELFHILPQLQVKRADFLPVMLTGTLPQRRTFSGLLPENELPEPQGPKDDDVTKSESNSEASQKSTERSQDGAPSTLMAEDLKGPREPVSGADADPDMEDASKTLVLFSPGDNRKSPCAGYPNLEADFGCAITPLKERSAMGEEIQADPSEPGGLTVALRSDLRATTPIAPASPPFTKVERTFIHIAETSHLNVMSSSSPTPKESDRDLFAVVQKASVDGGTNEWTNMVKQGDASSERSLDLQVQSALDGHLQNDLQPKPDNCSTFVFVKSLESVPEATLPILAHEALCVNDSQKKLPKIKDITGQQKNYPEPEAPTPPKARIRSRIPVLVSEEDTGSEPSSSLSARTRLQRRVRQLDLARLVVEKQQGQWMRRRLISGTSSSLSSGDDERRRASETLSTTGSEEDTHASDESLARKTSRLKLTGEGGPTEWRSRIPRPVTPIKRPSGRLVAAAAPSPLTLPGRGISRAATFIGNGLQSQRVGLSTLHTQKRSKTMPIGSASSSCPRPSPGPSQPCGSPRMPLRCVFAARRSLSTSHCRTDSPSPQRVRPIRQPLSVRPTTAPPPRPRTTNTLQRSASQDPTMLSSTATPVKVRPKSTGPAKGKQSTGDKLSSAR